MKNIHAENAMERTPAGIITHKKYIFITYEEENRRSQHVIRQLRIAYKNYNHFKLAFH